MAAESWKAVHLTERAQELARLEEKVRSVPEARSPKVDAICNALREGTYEVSGAAVAESLLRDLLGVH